MFLDENGVPLWEEYIQRRKHGLLSFKIVLQKVHEAYADQRDKIIEQKTLSKVRIKKNKSYQSRV